MIATDRRTADFHASSVLPLLVILFACSGCSALMYEIIWYQLLQFVIGSTAISLGVLLATFMGGLCLGSIALPRIRALRGYHPLRVYAALEFATGVCGILVLFAMPLVNRVYLEAVGHGLSAVLLRAAICAICLLPPTLLMGASLPVIARWTKTTPQGVVWLGFLYGANTAGAVGGCLLAGFYLLRIFDMTTGTYVAAAINAAVAVASLGLAMRTPFQAAADAPVFPMEAGVASAPRSWPVYATIALSGACALGAEVIWTRLLGLILGGTVYTFSIILAVFLVGLGIGSGVGSWLASAVPSRAALLGYCQLLLTAAIAWTAFALAKSLPNWPIDSTPTINAWHLFQGSLLRVIWAILPATLLWGASFPLALAAAAHRDDNPERLVGSVYAANTGGAIFGALAFSMLLIPAMGTRQSERVLIGLSALSALFVLAPYVWPLRAKFGGFSLAGSMVVAGFLIWSVPAVPAGVMAYGRMAKSQAGNFQVLYVGEGLNSTVAISRWGDVLQFHVSGKVEASTLGGDMRLQRMLGHMPALVHGDPHSVLVVGFGAGVTAGSFVLYPGIRRIVVCEMEPLIPPVATQYFAKENYGVLHDKRTEMVYDDARHYVLTTPEKFDIITSDPIHPWVKGSATLYTKEYFQMVKEHLNPGGVVTQWVPLYETDLDTVKSELATFFDVFPNGTVWANDLDGEGYDLFLMAQTAPMKIDVGALQQRLDRPDYAPVAASLRDVGFNSALEMLATYAGQGSDLGPWLKDAQINRDGTMRLQYLSGWALNMYQQGFIHDDMFRYRRFPSNLLIGTDQDVMALRTQLDPKE